MHNGYMNNLYRICYVIFWYLMVPYLVFVWSCMGNWAVGPGMVEAVHGGGGDWAKQMDERLQYPMASVHFKVVY